MLTIRVRGRNRDDIRRQVRQVVASFCGRGTDTDTITEAKVEVGRAFLKLAVTSFRDKSAGGGGADGQAWAPLAPATVAKRLAKLGVASPAQATQSVVQAAQKLQRTHRGSKSQTAALKRYQKAQAQVQASFAALPILVDLVASLEPQGAQQVLRAEANGVTVGTQDEKAPFHMTGTARMPQRRLWPETRNWPDQWRETLASTLGNGILTVIADQLGAHP